MSCLLPLVFGVCLANPSELRIEASAGAQVAGGYHTYVRGRDMGTSPILGRVSVAMDVPVSANVTFRYGLEHSSLLVTSQDRGRETVFLGFTWRPFR